jgi:hypothetical protein
MAIAEVTKVVSDILTAGFGKGLGLGGAFFLTRRKKTTPLLGSGRGTIVWY